MQNMDETESQRNELTRPNIRHYVFRSFHIFAFFMQNQKEWARNTTDGKIRKWVWAVVNNFFDFWTFHALDALDALCKREPKVSTSTKYFLCILWAINIFYFVFEFFVVSFYVLCFFFGWNKCKNESFYDCRWIEFVWNGWNMRTQ